MKIILHTFQVALQGKAWIAGNPDIPHPFMFVFNNRDIVEDLSREKVLREIDTEEKTLQDRLDEAEAQLSAYRRAPAIQSVLSALMTEMQSAVGVTWDESLNHCDCLVVCKDIDFAKWFLGKEDPVN